MEEYALFGEITVSCLVVAPAFPLTWPLTWPSITRKITSKDYVFLTSFS